MPLQAPKEEPKKKQLIPAGSHIARCYSVIDIGTQPNPFGDPKAVLRIGWELPEKAVFREENGLEPFVISKKYTFSLYEKSNLYADLLSWFGNPPAPGLDLIELIGEPCMLSIVHKKTQKGADYAQVATVSGLPKGVKCPAQINPSVEYSQTQGQNATFKALPEWLRNDIAGCEEWVGTGGITNELDADGEVIPF